MIERKRYLELCQKNAVYKDAAKVYYNGSAFYPISLEIWFDGFGATHNSAIMKNENSNCTTKCRIEDIVEGKDD
jgi:hypothetical protein